MSGGLLQLVARNIEDIFLIDNPDITFFKVVYRRHTNFSHEDIPQYFSTPPGFGGRSSCTIGKAGDMAGKMHLVMTIPAINKYVTSTDNIYMFQWVKRLAFAIIDYMEIEIGGQPIDRHYGEWMSIWYDLSRSRTDGSGYAKQIANVSHLESITESKGEYTLHIPLHFWFCKYIGMSLPLINLYYNEVKLHMKLNSAEHCYKLHPASFIKVDDDIVPFTKGEYITQTVNGKTMSGEFIYFDRYSKKLYFTRTSTDKFKGISINDTNASDYVITGKASKYTVSPTENERVNRMPKDWVNNIEITNCFVMVRYYYLDRDERIKFTENSHEYLIEQVQHNNDVTLSNVFSQTIKLAYDNPCTELVWVTQLDRARKNKDWFNYTTSHEYINDEYDGDNIINEQTLIFNGLERESFRPSWYFELLQSFEHHYRGSARGINVYSPDYMPEFAQPMGPANLGMISDVSVRCSFNRTVESVRFASYVVTRNVLRVSDGFSGLVFVR